MYIIIGQKNVYYHWSKKCILSLVKKMYQKVSLVDVEWYFNGILFRNSLIKALKMPFIKLDGGRS